jgi:acetolactate synthase-1/2/3 large subunit
LGAYIGMDLVAQFKGSVVGLIPKDQGVEASDNSFNARGAVLHGESFEAAGRLQVVRGARLVCDTFSPHNELGYGHVSVERIPYSAEEVLKMLEGVEQISLVGSRSPVSFFAYPVKSSWCTPESCKIIYLTHSRDDSVGVLDVLAGALNASKRANFRNAYELSGCPFGVPQLLQSAR